MRTIVTIVFAIITSTLLNAQDFESLLIDYKIDNTFEGYDLMNYANTFDLKEVDKIKNISIYVNPTKNLIEINYCGVVYEIESYDMMGLSIIYYSGDIQFKTSLYFFEMYCDYDSDYNKYRYVETNIIKNSKNHYNDKAIKKYNKWYN